MTPPFNGALQKDFNSNNRAKMTFGYLFQKA